MTSDVRHDPNRSRYELILGDEVASYAEYRDVNGTRVITHTVTQPAFRGRGLATTLISHVLAAMRESNLRVVGLCPFVHHYLIEHPDDSDLVDQDLDQRLRH